MSFSTAWSLGAATPGARLRRSSSVVVDAGVVVSASVAGSGAGVKTRLSMAIC